MNKRVAILSIVGAGLIGLAAFPPARLADWASARLGVPEQPRLVPLDEVRQGIGVYDGLIRDGSASEILEEALHLYERSTQPTNMLRNSQARQLAEAALEKDNSLARAWALIADTYSREFRSANADPAFFDLASEAATRAIELAPEEAHAYKSAALALGIRGRIHQMVEMLETAARLDPLEPRYPYDIGVTLLYTGDFGEAVVAFERAWELGYPRGRLADNLAFAYMLLEDYDRAIAWAEYSRALGETTRWGAPLARAYLFTGRADEGLAVRDTRSNRLLAGDLEGARSLGSARGSGSEYAQSVGFWRLTTVESVLLLGLENTERAKRGRQIYADGAEERLIRWITEGNQHPNHRWDLASLAVLEGDIPVARRWAAEAHRMGWRIPAFAEHDPIWAEARNDPEIRALLDTMRDELAAMREQAPRLDPPS